MTPIEQSRSLAGEGFGRAMGWVDLRQRAEYAAFRLGGILLASLPLEWASGFSGRIWRFLAPTTARHSRALDHLLRAFPEKSAEERERIARAMWETLGRTFAEAFHMREIYESDRLDTRAIVAPITEASDGQGFVLCAAHQGNWEVAVMGLVRIGVKPSGIYQRIKNPYVDAWVKRERECFYPAGLFEKGPAASAPMIRNLKRGGCLAMLADLRDNTGLRVPFFGAPAPSTLFPARIARTLGVPLVAYLVVREPGVHFRFEIVPIEVPKTADRDADIAEATARLQSVFESSIRERPEQWMWAHRRWG